METADPWGPTTAERDQAANWLKNAVSDGRLTLEEFNQRLDTVYAAKSSAEIHAVLAHVTPPLTRNRKHFLGPLIAVGVAAAALLFAGAVAAIGDAAHSATEGRDCGCGSPLSYLTNQNDGGQQASTSFGAPDPVTCTRSVPFSAMETATLNGPFWLPLPNRRQAQRCFAVAHLATSARPSKATLHVHLELQFMSGAVQVPRGLGVDPATHAHTAMYTDNDQGVVTVESTRSHTLGQLFEEWGHPLTRNSVGHMRMLDGYPMHWYVNGAPVLQPASLVLHNHDQIECFQDMRGAPINPDSSYDFPAGY